MLRAGRENPAEGDGAREVMVFERQIDAFVWETGCLETVETTVHIKVDLKESSQEAFITDFGKGLVDKAAMAWSILMNHISYKALA